MADAITIAAAIGALPVVAEVAAAVSVARRSAEAMAAAVTPVVDMAAGVTVVVAMVAAVTTSRKFLSPKALLFARGAFPFAGRLLCNRVASWRLSSYSG